MINKKYKVGYIFVIITCIVLMLVGAKYDWVITDTLYNPKSYFGIIFESFSRLPIYLFMPIWGATLMIRNRNKMNTFVLGLVLLVATNTGFAYKICSDLAERGMLHKVNPYICGIMGGIAAAILFLLMRNIGKQTVKKIQMMCSFAFFYMAAYFVSITALKIICGRDRYEDIITGGEYAFAEWFKPVFFSDGSSFPSGHTAGAMGIIILLLLPFVFDYFKNKKIILFVGCYGFVAITAFSRLVMGKHFLSDTAMAVLVMTIVFMILTPFFEKMYKRDLIKQ